MNTLRKRALTALTVNWLILTGQEKTGMEILSKRAPSRIPPKIIRNENRTMEIQRMTMKAEVLCLGRRFPAVSERADAKRLAAVFWLSIFSRAVMLIMIAIAESARMINNGIRCRNQSSVNNRPFVVV